MDRVIFLKKIHKEIKTHLRLFEEVISGELLDPLFAGNTFRNLVHFIEDCKKVEKSLFSDIGESNPLMEREIKKRLDFFDRSLSGHTNAIKDAFSSRNIVNLKLSLENDGAMFISNARKKILLEKMIFDKLIFLNLIKSGMDFESAPQ